MGEMGRGERWRCIHSDCYKTDEESVERNVNLLLRVSGFCMPKTGRYPWQKEAAPRVSHDAVN